jgi:hypothetical protein
MSTIHDSDPLNPRECMWGRLVLALSALTRILRRTPSPLQDETTPPSPMGPTSISGHAERSHPPVGARRRRNATVSLGSLLALVVIPGLAIAVLLGYSEQVALGFLGSMVAQLACDAIRAIRRSRRSRE